MNILTFDIEEWFIEWQRQNRTEKYAEFDRYLNAILDKLDECKISATFFCVGEMGRLFPDVIRKIQKRNHEIGCHSNIHTWLNKMTEDGCREDTRCAVDQLEQCIGVKVKSYRAPAFSIGKSNKWAFEVLAENGIERDASIFPAKRDFGGFPNFGQKTPCIVEYSGCCIKEFPVCMTKVFGKEIAYSGGGYFRFFPLSFVKKEMAKSDYSMCYFHINDLVSESVKVKTKEEYETYYKERGTFKARYMRHIKTNLGKKKAFAKMIHLLEFGDFLNLVEADKVIDWNNENRVVI